MIALKRLNERSGATWMGAIENITKIDYIVWFLGFFSILFAVKEVIELFSYFKKKLRIKTGLDEDKETLESRIATLESHDKWQYKEISKISAGIDDIKDTLLEDNIEKKRKSILDFCSSLSNEQKQNSEAFNDIFRTYADYEQILKDNGMENGQAEESMKFIREKYQEKLHNGEFNI
ncbi:MAG: hypothetical protein MSH33_05025 [Fusobacterium necrophorum]|nr:hypothetical protein [Fusobacterium necrophorum]